MRFYKPLFGRSVVQLVGWSVTKLFKRHFIGFEDSWLFWRQFLCVFFHRPVGLSVGLSVHPSVHPSVCLSVLVCLFICLPDFSESADARDLGLMTLFLFEQVLCHITGHWQPKSPQKLQKIKKICKRRVNYFPIMKNLVVSSQSMWNW